MATFTVLNATGDTKHMECEGTGADSSNGIKPAVALVPRASGGLSINRLISAATTNATSVKVTAGQVYGFVVGNNHASTAAYFKLYNKASAPTVGTDTPVATYFVKASDVLVVDIPAGHEFSTGIAFALTTGIADSDTGAVGANNLAVNLFYE